MALRLPVKTSCIFVAVLTSFLFFAVYLNVQHIEMTFSSTYKASINIAQNTNSTSSSVLQNFSPPKQASPNPPPDAIITYSSSSQQDKIKTASPPQEQANSSSDLTNISQSSAASVASNSDSQTSSSAVNSVSVAPAISSLTPTPQSPPSSLPSKIVAGYYGGWAAYSGYTPDMIVASKLDIINFAFANIGSDYKISVGDPVVDYSNFAKLNNLKRTNTSLKTIISVGGWSYSSRFSDMALTSASRNAFALSCVSFIKTYGFDGVDIDWEYPVSGGVSSGRPEDKQNFTLLLQGLRQALDAQGAADGKHYYLSYAGGASNSYIGNVELAKTASYVDYAMIMTYDLHGPWDSFADFNAPLYTPTEASPQYKISVNSSVCNWLAKGFPASKLTMGIPFYGYIYSGVSVTENGLYQPFTSAIAKSYDYIIANYLKNSRFNQFFYQTASVPWLFGGSTFVSFDNPQTVAQKAQYAISKGLKGASIWELSYDKNGELLEPVYNSIH